MVTKRLVAWCAAVTMGLLGVGMLPGPVQAQEKPELSVLVVPGDKCGATITFKNPSDHAFWGDWRTSDNAGKSDSEFPALPDNPADYGDGHDHGVTPELEPGDLPGTTFGLQYNPVLIPAGDTRVVEVEVDEATKVQARVWRGPEQKWYKPWTYPVTVYPCPEPTPSPTPSESPEPSPSPGPSPSPTLTPTEEPATCDDFSTQEQAQEAFEAGAEQLDGNDDGVACESLEKVSDQQELPVTGNGGNFLPGLVAVGVSLLLIGAAAMGFARFKRVRQN